MANILNDSFEDIVLSFQQLLSATDAVKNTLTSNRDLTKQIIRQNIARLLETLRSRESWLLDQVDLLCQSKIDLLQDRRELINRAIGCYDNLKIDTNQGDGLQIIKNNLKGQIHEVEAFVNSQQELAINGCIKFYGATELLIKQLNNFGRVDACNGQSDCQCFNYVKRMAFETPLMRKMDEPTRFDNLNQLNDDDKLIPTAIEECVPRFAVNSRIPNSENYQIRTYDTASRKRKNCYDKTCGCFIKPPLPNNNNLPYKAWLQCESSLQNEKKADGIPSQRNYSVADFYHKADIFPATDSSHSASSNLPQNTVVKSDSGNNSTPTDIDIWLVNRNSNLQDTAFPVSITNTITVSSFHKEDDIKKWLIGGEESSNKSIYSFNWKQESESIDRWCIKYNLESDSKPTLNDTSNFPYKVGHDLKLWLAGRTTSELTCEDLKHQLPEITETNNNNNLIDVKENDDAKYWLAKPSFAFSIVKTTNTNNLPDDIVQYFNRVLSEDSSKWLKDQYNCNIETIATVDESNTVTEELQYLSLSSNDQQLHAMPKEYGDIADNTNMHLWLANF